MIKSTKFKWAVLENIVWAICFTALAVIFQHWTIVLLSAFFINWFPKPKEEIEITGRSMLGDEA